MVEKTNEELLAESKIREDNLKIEQEAAGTRAEQLAIEEKLVAARREQARLMFELSDKSDSAREFYKQALVSANAMTKARQEELKVIGEQNEKLKEQEKIQGRLGDSVGSLANLWRGGILESVLDTGISTDSLKEGFKQMANPVNIIGTLMSSVLQSTILAVKQAGDLKAQYVGATGDLEGFNSEILGFDGAATGAMRFGVGMEEASKASMALRENMSTFTAADEDQRKAMIQTAASFENLGVSSAEFGSNLQEMQMSLGMTADEALETQKGFTKMAKGIGVPLNKLSKDFAQNGKALAAYGDSAIQVFEELSKTSKQTGLDMSELLSITQKFDTFEGAADAAGKMNQLLGGPFLDSMQLLGAETEQQRVALLQNSLQMSGKSFDSMSKFEKQALALATTQGDVSKAAALFSAKARAMRKETDAAGMSQERLEELQRQSVTVGQDLKMIMQSLAVAIGPLVTVVKFLASGFLQLNDFFEGFLGQGIGAVAAIGSIVAAFMTFKKVRDIIRNLSGDIEDLGPTVEDTVGGAGDASESFFSRLGSGLRSLGQGLSDFFKGLGNVIVNLVKDLASVVTIIVDTLANGLASVGRGIASFITTVAAAAGPAIVGLLTALGAGLTAMLTPLANPAVAFGALVFAGVMISIGLAAAGVSLLVSSFSKLISTVMEGATELPATLVNIMGLAGSFALLGASLVIASGGMALLAGVSFASSISFGLSSLAVGALAYAFHKLADAAKTVSTSMKGQGSLDSVMKTLDEADTSAIKELATAFESLSEGLSSSVTSMVQFGTASQVLGLSLLTPTLVVSALASAFTDLATSASSFAESMQELQGGGSMTTFVATVKTIEASDVDNLSELINEADKMVTVQAKLVALDAATSISSAIDKLVSYVVPDSSDSSKPQREIVLQINDREFGRAVVESLGDDMKLSLA